MALSARKFTSAIPMFAALAASLTPQANAEQFSDRADSRLAFAGPPIVHALAEKISRADAEEYSGAVLADVRDVMLAKRDKYTARNSQGLYTYSYYVPATQDLASSSVYLCYGDKSGKPLVEAVITPQEKVVFLSPAESFKSVSVSSDVPLATSPASCLEGMKAYYKANKSGTQVVANTEQQQPLRPVVTAAAAGMNP